MPDQFGHSDTDLERGDIEYMRAREDRKLAPARHAQLKHHVDFVGRVDGMGEKSERGDYIGLDVTPVYRGVFWA